MSDRTFESHDLDTAPDASKPFLEQAKAKFGFVPNLLKVQAGAPALVEAYLTLNGIYGKTSLTATEQQVVAQTANFVNDCHYCVPAHTAISNGAGVPQDVTESLRNGAEIADAKLEALRVFARAMIEQRGHVGDDAVQDVLDAGYTQQQVLEVVVGLSLKVLSNYTNAIAGTELDEAFRPFAWTKPEPVGV